MELDRLKGGWHLLQLINEKYDICEGHLLEIKCNYVKNSLVIPLIGGKEWWMADQEDRYTDVFSRYANVNVQIFEAIIRSSADPFFRSSWEDLQKTLRSMEPMVKDMQLPEMALSHFVTEFLRLLERVEDRIRSFLESERPPALSRVGNLTASIFIWLGNELSASYKLSILFKKDLEITRESFQVLYANYVKEELDKLAQSTQEGADEAMTEKLIRDLLFKIRNEAFRPSANPLLKKIRIILEFLENGICRRRQQQGNQYFSQPPTDMFHMPSLLRQLKEVKLLLRFLNGDHGLDILNRLLESERALRMFIPVDDVIESLKKIDWSYENQQSESQRRKVISFVVALLVIGVLKLADRLDKPGYPNSPSEFVSCAIFAFIILGLACYLVMQIFTHFRLGNYDAQSQSSDSNNSCCGGFQLNILVVVVVVVAVVSIFMAVPDEPKKYDVFLNFRGSEEIRYTVAGVFHSSLEKANINTFFDERNARKSKRFLEEIENAINTSVGAITIFSEHYGESEYCLDELLLILEREKTYKGYMVRPIFYDVEPDDLTDPKSKFGQGLQKHYMTQWKDKVEEWKEALKIVTLIGGDVHKSSRHHLDELVYKVVEDFKNHLENIRGTEDNTILKWRSLIMKVTQPFTLQLGQVNLVIDLWNWKLHLKSAS